MSRKRKRILVLMVSFIILFVAVFITMENRANALLADTADAVIRARITRLANDCVLKTVSENSEFVDLVSIQTNQEGVVSYISANSLKMNALAYNTSSSMQESLDSLSAQDIYIKWTALFGSELFSGMGPSVGIQVQPIGSVKTAYISEFTSAGINQTQHRIYLEVKNNISIVMPAGSKSVEVVTQIVVSECLIVGVVPNSYVYVDEMDSMLNLIPD